MGDIQMDAGISELRFLVLLWTQIRKTSDEVDVRVPRFGGWWQAAGYSRQRSSSPWHSLTDSFSGSGGLVFSSEISLAAPAPGR